MIEYIDELKPSKIEYLDDGPKPEGYINNIYKSLFPRAYDKIKEGTTSTRAAASAVGDLMTLLPRSGFALKDAIKAPKGQGIQAYQDKLQQSEPRGLAENILVDPTLIPSLSIPTTTVAKGAPLIDKLINALKIGGKTAGVKAPFRVSEKYGAGKDLKTAVVESLPEAAITAALPVAMTTAGHSLKKAGAYGMGKYLKPKESVLKKGAVWPDKITPSEAGMEVLETPGVASMMPFKGGASAMERRASVLKDQINKKVSEIVNKRTPDIVVGKGLAISAKGPGKVAPVLIDPKKALDQAYKEVMEEVSQGKHVGDLKALNNHMNLWRDNIKEIFGDKMLKPQQAMNLIKSVGTKGFEHPSTAPEMLKGGEVMSREIWKKLRTDLGKHIPEIEPSMEELSSLHTVIDILRDAGIRTEKRNIFGLLGSMFGIGGGLASHMSGKDPITTGLTALTTLGIYKGVSSPQMATAAHRLGLALQNPNVQKIGSALARKEVSLKEKDKKAAMQRRLSE